MELPKLITQCLPLLRSLTNNNVCDEALVNVLNSKLAYMFAVKGIKFQQYSNSNPKSLAYYGINFMASGTAKDYTVSIINDYLLDFIEPYLQNYLISYKEHYYEEQVHLRTSTVANPKQKEKIIAQIDEELKQFRHINIEIEEGTLSGVYAEARQIDQIGVGSLFIRISELGDYVDSAVKSDKDKRALMQKMKNIYEGTVMPSLIASATDRRPIYNLGVQALMYTDFQNLLDSQNNKFFKDLLKTGYARRCFIYMPKSDDVKLNYPTDSLTAESAIRNSRAVRNDLCGIFEQTFPRTLQFSEECQQFIEQYRCHCVDIVNEMQHKRDIVATDLLESFWKIQKLSVVYELLNNPKSNCVTVNAFQQALSFYEAIRPSLRYMLERHDVTPLDECVTFLIDNVGKTLKKMDLRRQNFVYHAKFSSWWKDALPLLTEELQAKGYSLIIDKNDISVINNIPDGPDDPFFDNLK